MDSPSIETRIEYISSADEEGSGPSGEVAVTSAGGTASMPFQLAKKLNLTFELSGSRIFFDWDNTENLKFSNGRKPWDDFNSARVRLKFNYNWNPQWTSFANVYTAAGWEEEMDDSYSYGASIGTVFQSPYNLRWTLGGLLRGRARKWVLGSFWRRRLESAQKGRRPAGHVRILKLAALSRDWCCVK